MREHDRERARKGPAVEFDVLIEIPKGSRNKYEVDHETRPDPPRPHAVHLDAVPRRLRLHRGHPGRGRRPARRAGAAAGRPAVPGRAGALPGDRHVPHDRREGRRRQGALRARRTTRGWSTCATSTTSRSSTGWRSSTSSRSTRTSSRARASRARPGSAGPRPRSEIEASRSSGCRTTRRASRALSASRRRRAPSVSRRRRSLTGR